MNPINIPNDATTTFPLTFADQFGRVIPALVGASAGVSDATQGVASISADGTMLSVGPVTDGLLGAFNVIYTDGTNPPATFPFQLVAPTPVVGINASNPVYAPK